MRPSYRPVIPPKPQLYRTQVLDHLGLVAGMFEELGIGDVIDKATAAKPGNADCDRRPCGQGHGAQWPGLFNQQLYLVPHFFQNKPPSRLIAPGIQASISTMTRSAVPWIRSMTMG